MSQDNTSLFYIYKGILIDGAYLLMQQLYVQMYIPRIILIFKLEGINAKMSIIFYQTKELEKNWVEEEYM